VTVPSVRKKTASGGSAAIGTASSATMLNVSWDNIKINWRLMESNTIELAAGLILKALTFDKKDHTGKRFGGHLKSQHDVQNTRASEY